MHPNKSHVSACMASASDVNSEVSELYMIETLNTKSVLGRAGLMAALTIGAAGCGSDATSATDASALGGPPTIQGFNATISNFNKVTLTWQTEGGDPSNLLYIYGPSLKGAATLDVGFQLQDGTTSFRVPFGTHRYTLAVRSAASERMTRQIEVDVAPPPPPDIISATELRVNMFDRVAQTISWAPVPDTFVQMLMPNGTQATTASSSYQVTSAELQSLQFGRHRYRLTTCRNVTDGDPYCGESSSVYVHIGGAKFDGDFRQFVPSGQGAGVSWSGSGNFWHLSSASLGIDQWLLTPSYSILAAKLKPGAHTLRLTTCNYAAVTECSNRSDVKASVAGTVSEIMVGLDQLVLGGTVVARIATAAGSVEAKALRTGLVGEISVNVGAPVSAGSQLLAILTDDVEHKQIVVGQSVAWSHRDWSIDFDPTTSRSFTTATRKLAGLPLDIVVHSAGALFSIGEFSQSIAHVPVGGAVTEYEVPLLRLLNPTVQRMVKVSPFGAFNGRSSITVLGERIIEVDGDVWFTQGGQEGDNGLANHARVVRFAPFAADDPATDDDDRFCAYNVPENNNAVVGIAWDGTRMWVAEARTGVAPVLSSFNPSELPCENYLNFDDPAKVAQSAHQYCTAANQPGCFRKVALPGLIGAGHLVVDPYANAVWFTEFYAGGIGRYDMATGAVTRFPLPAPAIPSWYESAPWQIRVDAGYVYVNEFWDNDLVRFNKALPSAQCTALDASGANPCMSEIHLPLNVGAAMTHSIDLHGSRLWFTRGDVIGYVDTSTWASGVIYTGLPSLVDPARADVAPASYCGISVHPVTGTVAVADFDRKQLLRLVAR
jgi:hypothetical protein